MKLIHSAIAALIGATVAIGSPVAAHADSESSTGNVTVRADVRGNVIRDTMMCTYDDGPISGQWCGTVRLYNKGPVRAEGNEGKRYASCEFGRVVRYLGWSTTNMSNGSRYRTMESAIKPGRFHLYKITNERVAYFPQGCSFPNL